MGCSLINESGIWFCADLCVFGNGSLRCGVRVIGTVTVCSYLLVWILMLWRLGFRCGL